MAENSAIEWTDHTFNPWIGCTKVSPGCDHCYAERDMAGRLKVVQWGPHSARVRTKPANWRKPLAWNSKHEQFFAEHGRRQRVFCSSLADVFDNAVADEWRNDLANLIQDTPHLDWLLLTKRIGNAGAMLRAMFLDGVPDNVWLGATIVNQAEADRDIPKLLRTEASVHFLSMEPLLGPVDLTTAACKPCPTSGGNLSMDPTTGAYECCSRCDFTGIGDEWGIDWVIVGGESGPGARPMHPDWARSLRDQCAAVGVPFLFKQWGEHALTYDRDRDDPDWSRCGEMDRRPGRWINLAGGHGFHGERVHFAERVGKKAAGRKLDGAQHDGYPEAQR